MKDIKLIYFDIGTTNLKAVFNHEEKLIMNTYTNKNPNSIIHRLSKKYSFDRIVITGSGSRFVDESYNSIKLNELECTANIIKYMNMNYGLVINIGTGTSYVNYYNNSYEHLNGTGIGGGTYVGLGKRLLGTSEPAEIENLALKGDLKNINIQIEDIYNDGIGWLQKDITVSNFGKLEGQKEDIAIGIHSLIAEPIMSILKGMLNNGKFENIVFSGGVVNNKIIKRIIMKYANVFNIKIKFLDNPSYGTCLGAIALVESNIKKYI